MVIAISKGGIENMKDNSAPKNRLKELRDRSRLTLEEVSMITGFSVPTISRHESGGRSLSEEAAIKYASLYKVQTHELFFELQGEEEEGHE
jgi:transcriptional regulator with XRE-family HTH domain